MTAWQPQAVAALLRAAGTARIDDAVELVRGVLAADACRELVRRFAGVKPLHDATDEPIAVDELVPEPIRREHGMFFTPSILASRLAEIALDTDARGHVVDLSCGAGVLLTAAARRAPHIQLVGVEQEIVFALAAALALRDFDATVIWDDGLKMRGELSGATAVVGNPPYVGEKNNRELFARVRAAHPDLEQYFGPRIDLHYLFLHRALDVLRPGGVLAYLTSEYWLTATGAATLRRDLQSRGEELRFESLGQGAFRSAPGHHSLIFSGRRRQQAEEGSGQPWHPFAAVARDETGIPLGELCEDKQGFVSGADRVTARTAAKYGLQRDRPVYIWREGELPADDRDLFRPLLRRSDCAPGEIHLEPPGHDWVLWCDGDEPDATRARIERLLAPFREPLQARREVKKGIMRWSRIWWPRRTADYARPKLVVPRRSTSAAFCLDLSGCHVSSDCTFLLARDEIEDEIGWLIRVMLAANSESAQAQFRAYGKTKGEIMEFYSEPLRSWRLPLTRTDDGLRLLDPQLEARAVALRSNGSSG